MTSIYTPTPEQQEIIDAALTGDNLAIQAGAGTGKTTTLRLLADAEPAAKGLYLAYNRATKDDAARMFPKTVLCSTAHGLAYRAIGNRYRHRLNGPRIPALETARILGLPPQVALAAEAPPAPKAKKQPEVALPAKHAARIVMETITRFCHSDDHEPTGWHVPFVPGLDDPGIRRQLQAVIVPLARKAWREDITQPDGRLRFTHDCYLKLWALSEPTLPYDYILLDEAQDANPVIAEVVAKQTHAQRILVGDTCQAIYSWRGAIDAMTRFAHAIAAEANKWLTVLDAPLRLRGFEQLNSQVAELPLPDAILCRTNAEAVAQLLQAADGGRRGALVGGGWEIKRLAEAAITLKAGQGTDHPELFMFTTWGAVQDYVAEDASGSDLKVFVQLIDSYGPDVVIDVVNGLVDERNADVVVSTAHKAKGREWRRVRIAGDFREPKAKENGEPGGIPSEDAMLAYVAVTRAQLMLDPGGLSWVDKYLGQGSTA